MHFADLIGRPWQIPCNPPKSFDCWALVIEVRNRMGLETKAYDVPAEARRLADRAAMANPDPRYWKRLERPYNGCLVGFGGDIISHCGVYFDRNVIHSAHRQGVAVQPVEVCRNFFGPVSFWDMVQHGEN